MVSLAPFSVGCANGISLDLGNRDNLKRKVIEQAVKSSADPPVARNNAEFRQCASRHEKNIIRRHRRLASIGVCLILQHRENG